MKAFKNGADLSFICDDGKTVKYNLNTHECIGKNGKSCKYLNSQLKDYTVCEIADSFEDKNFGKFLNYVASKASNNSLPLSNIGTVFQRLDRYQNAEQFYSAGLIPGDFRGKINEVPKGLIKILKEIKLGVNKYPVEQYKAHPDAFNYAFNHPFISLDKKDAYQLLLYTFISMIGTLTDMKIRICSLTFVIRLAILQNLC